MEADEVAELAAAAAESVAVAAVATNEALGPCEVPSRLAASPTCLCWGWVCWQRWPEWKLPIWTQALARLQLATGLSLAGAADEGDRQESLEPGPCFVGLV